MARRPSAPREGCQSAFPVLNSWVMDLKNTIYLLGCAAFLAGCAVVPETGRKRSALVSDSVAMQMGLSEFEKMKQSAPINTDPEINAMVRRVGERIAAVVAKDMPNAQWEFVVFDSAEPNAFALPGGKVGIYTGILSLTRDEAGLATVIGHEVAHAVAGHGAERVSDKMLWQLGGALLGAATQDRSMQTRQLISRAYGLGAALGRELPHGRKQESEADYMGLLYMARAGYNPEAAVAFWQRFAAYSAQQGGQTPWFLRTHPLKEQRIADIRGWLPEAKAQYRPR